jgi:hypothetical protein
MGFYYIQLKICEVSLFGVFKTTEILWYSINAVSHFSTTVNMKMLPLSPLRAYSKLAFMLAFFFTHFAPHPKVIVTEAMPPALQTSIHRTIFTCLFCPHRPAFVYAVVTRQFTQIIMKVSSRRRQIE